MQDTGWEKWEDPVYLTRGTNSTWSQLERCLNTPGHLLAFKLHPGLGYKMKPLEEYPKDTSVFKKVPLLQICNITLSLENSFARVETASAGYRGRTAVATVSVPSQGKTVIKVISVISVHKCQF